MLGSFLPPRASGNPTCSLSCSWEDTPLNSESPGPPALEVFYVDAVSEPATISSRCLVASEKCSLHIRAATGLPSWPPSVRGWQRPLPHTSKDFLSARGTCPTAQNGHPPARRPLQPVPRQCPRQSEIPRDRPAHALFSQIVEIWLFFYCEHRRMVGFSFQT